MESGGAGSAARSGRASGLVAATSSPGGAQSSKLDCLRRYVTDNAARLLVDGSREGGVDRLKHQGAQGRRRKKLAGTRNGPEGKTGLRGFTGLRLRHDALGETGSPPPRVQRGQRRANRLATGHNSNSSGQNAASFDALQYGRAQHPRAGWKAKGTYNLAAAEEEDKVSKFYRDSADSEVSEEEEDFCNGGRSDEEAVVVVDETGQSVCLNDGQQRQVKALLKAEEQPQKLQQRAGEEPAGTETLARTSGPTGVDPSSSTFRRKFRSPDSAQPRPRAGHANTETAEVADARGIQRGSHVGRDSLPREMQSHKQREYTDIEEPNAQAAGSRRRPRRNNDWYNNGESLSSPRGSHGSQRSPSPVESRRVGHVVSQHATGAFEDDQERLAEVGGPSLPRRSGESRGALDTAERGGGHHGVGHRSTTSAGHYLRWVAKDGDLSPPRRNPEMAGSLAVVRLQGCSNAGVRRSISPTAGYRKSLAKDGDLSSPSDLSSLSAKDASGRGSNIGETHGHSDIVSHHFASSTEDVRKWVGKDGDLSPPRRKYGSRGGSNVDKSPDRSRVVGRESAGSALEYQQWVTDDGDLSPPRRKAESRRGSEVTERRGLSYPVGYSSPSTTAEKPSFAAPSDDYGSCSAASSRMHSNKYVPGLERTRILLNASSDRTADRTATRSATPEAEQPVTHGASAKHPTEVATSHATDAGGSGITAGNMSPLVPETVVEREGTKTYERDDAPGRHLSERATSVERGSSERCSARRPGRKPTEERREPREESPPSKNVVYRDRLGRRITEEQWLELKDPARRGRERSRTERAPPVKLAWGGGLVQEAEKAQTAAEEILLAQKPLARYELDEDYDLELRRKQRWDDPAAKRLCRQPQEDARATSTLPTAVASNDVAEGAKPAGQLVSNAAVPPHPGARHKPIGTEWRALSEMGGYIPSLTPPMAGNTILGIRPLVGKTVAAATGAVRGAAHRVGRAIGAAAAASGITHPSATYSSQRRFQQTPADYPLPTGTWSTRTTRTAFDGFDTAQAAHVPAAAAFYGGLEQHLRSLEQHPSNAPLYSQQPRLIAPMPDGYRYPGQRSWPTGPPFETEAPVVHRLPTPNLEDYSNRALTPMTPLPAASAAPTFVGAAAGSAQPAPENPVAADPGVSTDQDRLMEEQAAWSSVSQHAVQPTGGPTGPQAQAPERVVPGSGTGVASRLPITFYDALSFAERLVVPSIEAIAKVAPTLPLAREGEKVRGRLYNRTDEAASDLNAPPAQQAPQVKGERRPRLYIPQVRDTQ